MASLDQSIVDQCKKAWEGEFVKGLKNRDNCSGFVKAVAKGLGIPLSETANADGLMDEISTKWTAIASGKEAAHQAEVGKFVLAGLKSGNHNPVRNNGHVCIVIAGGLYERSTPWCGVAAPAQRRARAQSRWARYGTAVIGMPSLTGAIPAAQHDDVMHRRRRQEPALSGSSFAAEEPPDILDRFSSR